MFDIAGSCAKLPQTVLAATAVGAGALLLERVPGDFLGSPGLAAALAAAAAGGAAAHLLLTRRSEPDVPASTQRAVLDAVLAATPVVLLDRRGRVRRMSPAATELFGQEPGARDGRPFDELAPGFPVQAVLSADHPAGRIEARESFWSGVRADGRQIPLDIHFNPTPEGPLLRLTDLTRRQAAHAQARELHSQLNKVWRLNSLGEMAATLAHELNQPLGAATTYLHAAQEDMRRAGPLGDSAARTTDLAKAQLLRAGQIIRRMRELLTMEMGALGRARLSEVVDDLMPILAPTAEARGVAVAVDIAADDAVRMDRIQFQQALVNLTRNAIEAAPAGGGGVVAIVGRPLDRNAYEIAVEDSGPGIPPDQVERVFQPMTTTKSGGMGLGLSVTRTIVERHGGQLRVGTSTLGGARFSFNLLRDHPEREEER